jgi:hypothetical protein
LPGFSPCITAAPPIWNKIHDILHYAKLYNLYYRLLGLKSIFHATVVRSRAFLSGESLRPSIISLQTGIVNYTKSTQTNMHMHLWSMHSRSEEV